MVEGDSFHRFEREEMERRTKQAMREGTHFSHFGLPANLLVKLATLFEEYGKSGTGRRRFYLHDRKIARRYGKPVGTFTEWEDIPLDSDLLFYEGLHGGVIHETVNVAQHVDLLIGVVPIVNLEWIQKIHRDTFARGYPPKDVTQTILRRMHDYVHIITPQFTNTDINIQRVPTVDTSNPFIARDIPTADESFAVIRFKDPEKFKTNFPNLLSMIHNSFMSRDNTIVVPGGKMVLAMELILRPIIRQMMRDRRLEKTKV